MVTPTIQRCSTCNVSLGVHTPDLFGKPAKCIQCETNDRCKMILTGLPDKDDYEFEKLSEWEQGFITSVREQFKRKGTLSPKQYEVLERVWDKHK